MQARPCINKKVSQQHDLPVSGDTIAANAASLHILLTCQPTKS